MEQISNEENPYATAGASNSRFGQLSEKHTPSKKQAVIFFVSTLVLAGALATWELFLNKGTLILSSDVPFHANVSGNDIFCETSPCSIVLKPRTYSVHFTREGYFDYVEKVDLRRFNEVIATPTFKLIPKLEKIKNKTLANTFPLSSLNTAPAKLPNFPETVEEINFNATATQAILTIGKDLYLYDVKSQTVGKLKISKGIPFTWSGSALIFLASNQDEGQTLLSYGLEKDTPLVNFDRPLVSPTLFGTPDSTYVLIREYDEKENHYYLVDLKALTRRRLNIDATLEFVGFSDAYGIFKSTKENDDTKYSLISLSDEQKVDLPKAQFGVAAQKNDSIYYITAEKTDDEGVSSSISIEDAVAQISDNLKNVTGEKKPDPQVVPDVVYYLTSYDLLTKKTQTIAPITLKEGQTVNDMSIIDEKVVVRVDGLIYELKDL